MRQIRFTLLSVLAFIAISISLSISGAVAQTASDQVAKGKEHFSNVEFDAARRIFDKVIQDQSNTADDRAEAYLWRAYCRSKTENGLTSDFGKDLQESVRLRPKYRLAKDAFPPTIENAYNQARSDVLTTAVIDVTPSDAVVTLDGVQVKTPFTDSCVVAGTHRIIAKTQGYVTDQRDETFLTRQVNRVAIKLEFAYGNLKISGKNALFPVDVIVNDSIPSDKLPYAQKLRVGDYRITLKSKYYQDTSFSVSVSEGSEKNVSPDLSPTPACSAMLKAKAEYGGKKRTNSLLKIITFAGAAGAGAFAVISHSAANTSYDKYTSSFTVQEIDKNYKDYESKSSLRNMAGAAAIGFAALEVIWFLTSPDKPSENPDDYAPKRGALALAFNPGRSGTYLELSYRVNLPW